MSIITVQDWHKGYYKQLLPQVRKEDKEELFLLGSLYGYSWQHMLARSILCSEYIKALIVKEECHGVVGVCPYSNKEYASIWLICSSIFKEYTQSFCRVARSIIEEVSKQYPVLCNCVSEDSLTLVSPFLVYCGFIIEKESFMISKTQWYPFTYKRE